VGSAGHADRDPYEDRCRLLATFHGIPFEIARPRGSIVLVTERAIGDGFAVLTVTAGATGA
jgi:hypothetical protein